MGFMGLTWAYIANSVYRVYICSHTHVFSDIITHSPERSQGSE